MSSAHWRIRPSNSVDRKVDDAAEQTASRLMAQENKMEQSFLHFKITNPEWQPSDPASMLLSRIADGEINSQRLKSPFRLRNGMLNSTQLGGSRSAKLRADAPFAGSDEDRLKQKSMVYEAALQRSLLLKSGAGGSRTATTGRSSRLQPMQEAPEVEDEDGWETAKLGERLHDQDQLQASAEGDSAPGMLGLIQQVIKK
jgi:autophagy-related protein 9